jgi:KipI family sensor histidine kinase inhibitor
MTITPLGDRARLVSVATEVGDSALARVQQVADALRAAQIEGVTEVVPAPLTVGVMLDGRVEGDEVDRHLDAVLAMVPAEAPALAGREREIPVWYGGEAGPDLEGVAAHAGLSPEAVVRRHAQGEYRVQAVGFSPGFPYLAGLCPRLHSPRRATPRARVAAGSVGIGGTQTGIYPLATPGGWNLIGRTPQLLFEATALSPAWLGPGDRVRFRAIDKAEFDRLTDINAEVRRVSLPPQSYPPFGVPAVEVLRPGIQTTVQDLGRPGWQGQGVPVGGAVDPVALTMANLLVGNAPGAAGLEWARQGPVLRFLVDRVVAVSGVEPTETPSGRPLLIRAGQVVDLGEARSGMRGYLAVAGGIEVPVLLGSRSTCLVARFGGWRGRPLRAGDALLMGEPAAVRTSDGWWLAPRWSREEGDAVIVRIVRGPHAERFSSMAWRVLTESTFLVQAESDRMAVRVTGAKLALEEPEEMISTAVAPGAIQVPPDGQPRVLLADCQTLGGYPQVAYVISADLPRLAQLCPGERLRLVEVSLPEAEAARREQRRELGLLGVGVRQRIQP